MRELAGMHRYTPRKLSTSVVAYSVAWGTSGADWLGLQSGPKPIDEGRDFVLARMKRNMTIRSIQYFVYTYEIKWQAVWIMTIVTIPLQGYQDNIPLDNIPGQYPSIRTHTAIVQGDIVQGDFVRGGYWNRWILSGGILKQVDFVRGDIETGGFCPGGYWNRWILSGGILKQLDIVRGDIVLEPFEVLSSEDIRLTPSHL